MKLAFVDTSYYLAILIPGEEHHTLAKTSIMDYDGKLVTSDYILMELGSALRFEPSRPILVSFWNSILTDANTEIISASSPLMQRGFDLFRSRPDKDWSLTDCISFSVMEQSRIQSAFTFDRHFQQAGFEMLCQQQS